jgi:hypothetical protein
MWRWHRNSRQFGHRHAAFSEPDDRTLRGDPEAIRRTFGDSVIEDDEASPASIQGATLRAHSMACYGLLNVGPRSCQGRSWGEALGCARRESQALEGQKHLSAGRLPTPTDRHF